MAYALIFAGQGTQHPGMFPWLASDPLAPSAPALAAMNGALGQPWRSVLEVPAQRHQNAAAQVLITGSSLAAWALLAPLLPDPPAVVAGYSVGELAASACAGALTVADAIGLAAERAACMDACAETSPSGPGPGAALLSVSGLSEAAVLASTAAAGCRLHCAIRIADDHAIWGGLAADLQTASVSLSRSGAVCQRLDIGVASHTPHMQQAAADFARRLALRPWQPLALPLVLSANASVCRQLPRVQAGLAYQLDHTIDWAACMDALAECGVDCVLEMGPGSPLSALWNRRHRHIPARALADFQGLAGAALWLRSMQS